MSLPVEGALLIAHSEVSNRFFFFFPRVLIVRRPSLRDGIGRALLTTPEGRSVASLSVSSVILSLPLGYVQKLILGSLPISLSVASKRLAGFCFIAVAVAAMRRQRKTIRTWYGAIIHLSVSLISNSACFCSRVICP